MDCDIPQRPQVFSRGGCGRGVLGILRWGLRISPVGNRVDLIDCDVQFRREMIVDCHDEVGCLHAASPALGRCMRL